MVNISDIVDNNARFASNGHEGRVRVFLGATSGTGLGTLRRFVTMLQSSTFYILGRTESRFASELERLMASAPTCKLVFIEAHVSFIRSINAACEKIMLSEDKVDYICMSPGGMPFQGALYTDEGLEVCFAVSYWSRARLTANLLPLLGQSPNARVLPMLNGTKEKRINEQDIGLKKWGIVPVVDHTTICTR
ncbi:short-chain dehydrogenase reductase [Seiridium cupressi]